MRGKEIPIRFEPYGKTVSVPEGTRILLAATKAGVCIDTPCGGHGTCGKCKVRLLENAPEASETERELLSAAEVEANVRLACQARVSYPCTVAIPEESLQAQVYQILDGGDGPAVVDVSDRAVHKQFVELRRPSRDDAVSDRERLARAIGPFEVEVNLLRALPGRLREGDWRGTAVLIGDRLIDFEPGADTSGACYAAAFDVGTTTVVGVLLDLTTGQECATCSRVNPQTGFGDDVLSRILHATQNPSGLEELQQVILLEVNSMTEELARGAGAPVEQIYEVAFSGNTTMLHLLTGIDLRALGQVPFTPAFQHGLSLPAVDLGLRMHPRARVYVFPVVGGFVGGDTVAGMLATDLEHADGPTVLVDIGTNGEIVVSHNGRLLATSTAAGPAFEGARISDGMRAAAGAIEHVMIAEEVEMDVIGGGPPVGLCGSALIDIVAELLRLGLLDAQGVLLGPDQVPDDVPAAVRARVTAGDDGPAFVLAPADTTKTGAPIRLTQRDVREFQLATGAIRSGVKILLSRVGLGPSDVARVLIAGAFGNYIRRDNAQRIGLLPEDVPPERLVFVGNASLAGARLAVASRQARDRAERLTRKTEHVDLSLDPDFQTEFAMAMYFPGFSS